MVTAGSLNFDVLEIIFSFLAGHDLASVSLVSRSFLAGVIPRLYRSLVFYRSHEKRFTRVMSPFAAVLVHPSLAIHVQNIDIRAIPNLRIHGKTMPHPRFLREASAAVTAATNLTSFTCTLSNALSSFLVPLQNKERLHTIWINAHITQEQMDKLMCIRGLTNIMLENASWQVLNTLPKWAQALQSSLQYLTIYSSRELNVEVLNSTVSHLHKLRGLHIVGCTGVDHVAILRLATEHTPLLESLAFSTTDCSHSTLGHPPLLHLRHLAVDSETLSPLATSSVPAIWGSILASTRAWSAPLTSLALRLSSRMLLGDAFVQEFADGHGATLRQLSLLNCGVSQKSVGVIAAKCEVLERLVVPVPTRDYVRASDKGAGADGGMHHPFNHALAKSKSLQTLVDIGDSHTSHGPRVSLRTDPVRDLMEKIPTLRKVVSDNRHWTSRTTVDGLSVSLDRKRQNHSALWFMPPA